MVYKGEHPYASNRLVTIFGGAEAWMELVGLLEYDDFSKAVAEYGKVHAAKKEEFSLYPDGLRRTISLRWSVAKLAAFAANRERDSSLAYRVWELLLSGDRFDDPDDSYCYPVRFISFKEPLSGKEIFMSNISTNYASQWGLNVIAALALVPEALEIWWQKHNGRLWSFDLDEDVIR